MASSLRLSLSRCRASWAQHLGKPGPLPPRWCGLWTRPGLTRTLGLQLVEQVSPGQVLEEVVVAVVHGA